MPIAYGSNTALVGKSLIDLKDQSGRFIVREIIKKAEQEVLVGLILDGENLFFQSILRALILGLKNLL